MQGERHEGEAAAVEVGLLVLEAAVVLGFSVVWEEALYSVALRRVEVRHTWNQIRPVRSHGLVSWEALADAAALDSIWMGREFAREVGRLCGRISQLLQKVVVPQIEEAV